MASPYHLLVIDDMKNIHEDFKNILTPAKSPAKKEIENLGNLIFEEKAPVVEDYQYQLNFAFQGMEGIEIVRRDLLKGIQYCIVFVDMIMPPGIDGIRTIKELWKIDPCIEMVICSAYSQYSWEDIKNVLGNKTHLHKVNKPFNSTEILTLVNQLIKKWVETCKPIETGGKTESSQIPTPTERFNKAIESLKKIHTKLEN